MRRLIVLAVPLLLLGLACGDDDSGNGEGTGDGSGADDGSDDGGTGGGSDDGGTGDGGTGDDGGTSDGGGSSDDGGTSDGGDACTILPADNPWNEDISGFEVHPNSDAFIAFIGNDTTLHPDFGTEWNGAPNGIPYDIVPGDQPRVPVEFDYADESDPGPYPIPPDAQIEGGPDGDGDRHVIALDLDNCMLYELFYAFPVDGGASWTAGSGAIFDLRSNDLRPDTWTSADAAGLPIFPGLVRYEEVVEEGVIDHALRFTVHATQPGYIYPATHYASTTDDPNAPPMGLRVRMKADYDCSGLSSEIQVICTALKTYGMYVADNGSDWFVSGAPNPSWSDDALADIRQIPGSAFEAVYTGEIRTY
jgi:hypothetical protein